MVIFWFSSEAGKIDNYMEVTRERLKRGDSFMFGSINKLPFKSEELDYYMVDITPNTPRLYLLGIVWLIATVFIRKLPFSWWYLPGFILLITYIFFNKYFYLYVIKYGSKKNGYPSRISMVKSSNILKNLCLKDLSID